MSIWNDGTGTTETNSYAVRPEKEYIVVTTKRKEGYINVGKSLSTEVNSVVTEDIRKEVFEEMTIDLKQEQQEGIIPKYKNISKEWESDIWIITSGELMALLNSQEYALYCGLNLLKYHNAQKNKPENFLWENQLKYSYLAEELQLYAGKNKAGEKSTVSRQTIGRLVNSLISKGVLTKKKVKLGDGAITYKYILVSAKQELFTKIEKPLLKVLTKTLKGQVIKTYAYIKAMYELSLKNGNKKLSILRETIAKAINEVSKKGTIDSRQLQNISMYLTLLYNLDLIKASVHIKQNIDGSYSSIIEIEGVNSKYKDLPQIKQDNKMRVRR